MNISFIVYAITTLTLSTSVPVPDTDTALIPMAVAEETTIDKDAFNNKLIVYHDLSIESEDYPGDYGIDLTTDKTESVAEVVNYDILQQITETSHKNSKPTKFHDLDDEDYYLSFDTNTQKTYTNYYFNPSPDGSIAVSISNIDCNELTITCCEVSSGTYVLSWMCNAPQANTSIQLKGLASDRMYYFKFSAGESNNISGSSRIYHPK